MLFALTPARAQIADINDAINKGGRQRALTQVMVRNYIQLGLQVRQDLAEKELPEAIQTFETTLNDLKTFSNNAEITAAVADVEKLWPPVKATLTAKPDRAKVEQLLADAENLLIASNDVVDLLVQASNRPDYEVLNHAALKRLMLQRLTVFVMMQGWGFTDPKYAKGRDDTINDFKAGLKELRALGINTPETLAKLDEIEKAFFRIEQGVQAGTSSFVLGMVANSAQKLFQNMNDVLSQYAKLQKSDYLPSIFQRALAAVFPSQNEAHN